MLCRIASGAGSTLRPTEEVHFIDVADRAEVVDDGIDVIPIGAERGHLIRIGWIAGLREQLRNVESLLGGAEVARIVHGVGARGATVACHVHGKDVIASLRESTPSNCSRRKGTSKETSAGVPAP